ncbi:MAG: GNAT family N-acetyltransferase [Bacilli bacterium]|nr:GNAT family N-acetyltransferase [Bacilli bacterium]
MYIISDDIKLSVLEDKEENYKLLEKWCNREEIYKHFEQRILKYDEIVNKYKPRCNINAEVPVYMIYYKNKKIGIIQYKNIKSNTYEFDIFIGEVNLHSKGLGEKVIKLITNYLIDNKGAETFLLCPLKENEKAIKCYKKCGYKIVKEYKDFNTIGEEKEYVMMEYNYENNSL